MVLNFWALSPSFHLSLEVVLIFYYFFFQPLMHLALLPEPGHGVVVVLSHAHGIWILGLADITVGVWQDLSHKKEYTIGLGRGIWIIQGGTHPWNDTRAGTLHTIPRKWWWFDGRALYSACQPYL